MKYYQCPVTPTVTYEGCSSKIMSPASCLRPHKSIKPIRSVHFPNDVLFQDYVRQGELERIGRFIRTSRVTLDTIYHSGMAAIHEAVLSGNLECVKLLVSYGADIMQRDEEGWTPLHMACSDGFPEIAKYLLSLGADPEAENECGEKPADLIDPDCKELVELICDTPPVGRAPRCSVNHAPSAVCFESFSTKGDSTGRLSAPKMVQNYKQTSGACSPTNTEELLTPAHEENVRFIHYTWQCVMREMQSFQGSENSNKGPQKYVERTPNPNLSSFTPVDLNDVRRRNTQDSKKS
ncbi:hypothetical protein SRHO_G00335800 [Serrasalmus rhombeus]